MRQALARWLRKLATALDPTDFSDREREIRFWNKYNQSYAVRDLLAEVERLRGQKVLQHPEAES